MHIIKEFYCWLGNLLKTLLTALPGDYILLRASATYTVVGWAPVALSKTLRLASVKSSPDWAVVWGEGDQFPLHHVPRDPVVPTDHFFVLHKMKRITAWILRFANSCRAHKCSSSLQIWLCKSLSQQKSIGSDSYSRITSFRKLRPIMIYPIRANRSTYDNIHHFELLEVKS